MQVLSEPDVVGLLDRLMAEVLPSRRGLAAWRALLRSHATVMRQLDAAVGHASVPSSVRRFGFWSAMATAITYAVFLVGYFIGSYLRPPWDIAIPVAASILIAPSFVLLTVGIHYATPESKRIWSHAAMAFALLYAAFVSIVYVTWLFVVEPHVLNHSRSAVAPFVFKRGSFVQMLDGLGYTYMSLAVSLTAGVFTGGRLARWIRGVAVASAPAAIGVFTSYVLFTPPYDLLGLPGTLLTLVYAVLLAVHFRRAAPVPGRPTQPWPEPSVPAARS